MAWYDFLFQRGRDPVSQAIINVLTSILGAAARFFGTLFQAEIEISDNIGRISDNLRALKANTEHEIGELRKFKFDPKWKTRVVNVPKAIEQIKKIMADFTDGWKKRFEKIEAPIHDFKLLFTAEKLQAGDPNEQAAGLSKAAVKIDEIATLIKQLAIATDAIKEVVDLFTEARHQIETLDAIFLQQGNSRQAVRRQSRIRLGKLHKQL